MTFAHNKRKVKLNKKKNKGPDESFQRSKLI